MLFTIYEKSKKYEKAADVKPLIAFIDRNHKKITEIILKKQVFQHEACEALFSAISKCKKLQKVTLNNIFTALPRDQMSECFKIILKNIDATRLVHFDMSHNALSCNFIPEFQEFLSNLKRCNTLKFVNCGLGQKGLKELSQCMKKLTNRSFVEIDLSENRITTGIQHLAEVIKEFNDLEELSLRSNSIPADDIHVFLKSIQDSPLKKLDIRDNAINSQGCAIIGSNLERWDLNELNLSDCLVDDQCVEELVNSYIKKKPIDKTIGGFPTGTIGICINLESNNITRTGYKALTRFLNECKVKKLSIYNNMDEDYTILVNYILESRNPCDLVYEEPEEELSEFSDRKDLSSLLADMSTGQHAKNDLQ